MTMLPTKPALPTPDPEAVRLAEIASRASAINEEMRHLVRNIAMRRKSAAFLYYSSGIDIANALLRSSQDKGVGVVLADVALRELAGRLIGEDQAAYLADEIQWATGSPLEPFGLDGRFEDAQGKSVADPAQATRFTVFVKPTE